MKKNLTILAVVLVSFMPVQALAAELQFEEAYILERNARLTDDLYSFGERTTIAGTVAGDAIIFGGIVIVEGTVEGDLIAAGGTISITGSVRDDVRVAGGTITISGPITGDLLVAGGEVTLTPSGSVGGDVLVAGVFVTPPGHVSVETLPREHARAMRDVVIRVRESTLSTSLASKSRTLLPSRASK